MQLYDNKGVIGHFGGAFHELFVWRWTYSRTDSWDLLQSMLWPYRDNINTICCVISRQLDLTVVGTWTSS